MDVEVRLDVAGIDAVELGKERDDVGRSHLMVLACQVQFDSIAGREDDGLAVVTRAKTGQGAGQLVAVEGQPLAQGNLGLVIVAADG
jgi:hypothetical protein